MEIKSPGLTRTGPLTGPLAPAAAQAPDSPVAPAPAEVPAEAAPAGDQAAVTATDLRAVAEGSALEPLVAGNMQAMQDLERLKEAGKLTPEVVAGLEKLATQPLAPGVDRQDLIATALRQMADPSAVNQGDRFTCAAAVVQTMLVKDDPAEYLRLVSGLASPEGTVTLQNGATITRDANWASDPTRSVIDNLMQPAFMQYAAGSYDSASDSRKTATGSGQGLYATEQDKLIAAVTGRQNVSILGSGPEVISQIGKATAEGKPVPAIIKYQDANGEVKGHAVLVESIKNGQVTYLDPKAGRKTVSLEEFQGKLQSASLPKEHVTPALEKVAMKDGEGLLAGGFLRRLRRAFSKIGKAIKKAFLKVVDFIAPILPILQIAAWFIPGLGPVVGMALKVAQGVVAAVNAYRAAKSGDFFGAIAAGAAAFSGVMSGPAAGAAAKFASYANTARSVVNAVKTGDFAGALAAVASVSGNQNLATAANVANAIQKKDVGAALGAVGAATGNETLATAGRVASAVQNKDYGAALGAVGAATGNETLNRAAALVNGAQQVKQAVENKDYMGAAMVVNGMAVDAKIMDAKDGQDVQRWLQRGQALDQARRTGNTEQMINVAAQTATELGVVSPQEYQAVMPQIKKGAELYQAVRRGDTAAAAQLGADVLAGAGVIDPKTAETAKALGQRVTPLKQAIEAKDYGSAAQIAARMGYEAGVMGVKDPQTLKKIEEIAGKASKLQEGLEAARRGDALRAAKIADDQLNEGRVQKRVQDEINEQRRALEDHFRDFEESMKG